MVTSEIWMEVVLSRGMLLNHLTLNNSFAPIGKLYLSQSPTIFWVFRIRYPIIVIKSLLTSKPLNVFMCVNTIMIMYLVLVFKE